MVKILEDFRIIVLIFKVSISITENVKKVKRRKQQLSVILPFKRASIKSALFSLSQDVFSFSYPFSLSSVSMVPVSALHLSPKLPPPSLPSRVPEPTLIFSRPYTPGHPDIFSPTAQQMCQQGEKCMWPLKVEFRAYFPIERFIPPPKKKYLPPPP